MLILKVCLSLLCSSLSLWGCCIVRNLHVIILTSQFWSWSVPWSHNPPGTGRHELAFVRYFPELIAREMGQQQSLIEFSTWKVVLPGRRWWGWRKNTFIKNGPSRQPVRYSSIFQWTWCAFRAEQRNLQQWLQILVLTSIYTFIYSITVQYLLILVGNFSTRMWRNSCSDLFFLPFLAAS